MNKKAIHIIALLTTILTPLAVLAQNPTSGTEDSNDPVAVYKEAGINAEQESSIRKMAQAYDEESAVKLKTLGELLQELKNLAYQAALDSDALLAKQEQINKLQSEMATDRIKLVIKIRGILNTSQNEKLATILQARLHQEEQSPPLK